MRERLSRVGTLPGEPQSAQSDGGATAADDNATIRDGRFDLAACDDKRRLAIDAWPTALNMEKK
ncbi:hypothetical protein DMC47_28075 [Nostoc sp. 3335mG]|nr:hypothetical protein DMC47_28075 [Nostoc sp. 3335mG]